MCLDAWMMAVPSNTNAYGFENMEKKKKIVSNGNKHLKIILALKCLSPVLCSMSCKVDTRK